MISSKQQQTTIFNKTLRLPFLQMYEYLKYMYEYSIYIYIYYDKKTFYMKDAISLELI